MIRLGKVLHVSNNKHLILRTKFKVNAKVAVLNEDLTQIGMTFDIFGPVDNPYVSIKPTVTKPERYVGRFLYTMNVGEEIKKSE